MAGGSLTTSVVFPFGKNSEGELSLENGGPLVGLGAVPLKLFDTLPVGDRFLFASTGAVYETGAKGADKVDVQIVKMEGGNTLKVPDAIPVEVLLAFNEDGTVCVPTPEVHTHIKGVVIFTHKFWGAVKIAEHTKSFEVLKYVPFVQGDVNVGISVKYGTVAVYKLGVLAIVNVDMPTIDPGDDEIEVYRIESKLLINKDGAWEMPDGWPDSPSYPNGATPPKPKVGVVSTRVHEAGYVSQWGYFYSKTFFVAIEKPYTGDLKYKPKKELVQGQGMASLKPELKIKAEEAMRARGKGVL